jgi:hypothetical protein
VRPLVLATALAVLAAPLAAQEEAASNRVSIVCVADGFAQNELASKFNPEFERMKKAILATDPIKDFPDAFEISSAANPATESGVTEKTADRRLPFGILEGIAIRLENAYPKFSKDTGSISVADKRDPKVTDFRFRYSDAKDVMTAVRKVLGERPVDSVILMANTTAYGGGTISFNSGPGTDFGLVTQPMVRNNPGTTLYPHESQECPNYNPPTSHSLDYTHIAIHELGHALFSLGDEYEKGRGTYKGGEPPTYNASIDATNGKWGKWIRAGKVGKPLPGGHEYKDGIYHPTDKCKMGDTGCRYCVVCKEAVVTRIFKQVSFIDGFSPTTTDLQEAALRDMQFSITPLASVKDKLKVEWWVNGKLLQGAGAGGESVTVPASRLQYGNNVITGIVSSTKFLVDPDVEFSGRTLPNHKRWTLYVAGTGTANGMRQR